MKVLKTTIHFAVLPHTKQRFVELPLHPSVSFLKKQCIHPRTSPAMSNVLTEILGWVHFYKNYI